MLHGGVWPATVIAKNCCELYAIDKQGLDHMLAIQPELQDMLGLPREPVPGRSRLGFESNLLYVPSAPLIKSANAAAGEDGMGWDRGAFPASWPPPVLR